MFSDYILTFSSKGRTSFEHTGTGIVMHKYINYDIHIKTSTHTIQSPHYTQVCKYIEIP